MKLIFDIIKSGKNFPSRRNFHINMTNGIIGRSLEADWQLVDKQNYISNKHVLIEYKDKMYFIKDISTNGTFLKHPYTRLPKQVPIKINSTDVFIIGDYELQARFSNNEYSSSDVLTNSSSLTHTSNYNTSSTIESSSTSSSIQLIPDDDFLSLDDSSIMDNTILQEEEISVSNNSVLDIFASEERENENIKEFAFANSEPTIIEEDFYTENISNNATFEHINIPSYQEEKSDIIDSSIIDDEKDSSTFEEEVIQTMPLQKKEKYLGENEGNDSLEILEKKLGIELSSLPKENRDLIISEIADIVTKSLDGLKKSLDLKDKVKKDLLIENINPAQEDANPIKMGQYALNLLDYKANGGIKLSEALSKSFNEIDIHNIALHRSSKNLINIAMNKFSPNSLEHHFDTNGQLNNLMPKKYQMWDAYIEMFKKLNEDPDFGLNLISKDFSNEYNNISYTIKLTSI